MKLNFALENKELFLSAVTSGKLVILMLKNLHVIMTQKDIKHNTISEFKKHISLLCFYINKSQKNVSMEAER